MLTDQEEFAAKEAAYYRAKVAECNLCEEDGWCPPIGPKDDGSYISSRPCPRGCAGRAEEAVRFETGRW